MPDAIAANCPTDPGPEIGAAWNPNTTSATSATSTNATAPAARASDSSERSLEVSKAPAPAGAGRANVVSLDVCVMAASVAG
ncbi:hypothetical protein [Microbacterium sp. HD4P20]|uniref:hypothetical protein n=1 Tax=Microbacterium sp. HD4P20 TaxID=2864874 RepID=UPI0035AB997B